MYGTRRTSFPRLVAARKDDRKTGAPGFEGTATVPDLDRAIEPAIRIAYLPYVDAVLTQFPQ